MEYSTENTTEKAILDAFKQCLNTTHVGKTRRGILFGMKNIEHTIIDRNDWKLMLKQIDVIENLYKENIIMTIRGEKLWLFCCNNDVTIQDINLWIFQIS